MKYRFYITSESAWDAMLSSIEKARDYVFIEMFVFDDDTWDTHDFIGEIITKAKKGIRVCLIIDAHGSRKFGDDMMKKLKEAGVEILFYSRWRRRIHKKIVIIDGKIGFLGGVNIARRFRLWNDLQMRVGSKFLVKELLCSFAYSYKMCGGKNKDILKHFSTKSFLHRRSAWIVNHRPELGFSSFRKHIKDLIDGTSHSLIIITPYFIPQRWLLSALDTARKRGVSVEVIFPFHTNHFLARRANFWFARKLHPSGVKFHLFSGMNHAKIILSDGKKGLVGSHNFDVISGFNYEVGMSFENKEAVAELSKIVEKWKKQSVVFDPAHHEKKWYDHLFGFFMFITRIFQI